MDLFSNCAAVAFAEVWKETRVFPPDSEAVRIRATEYYEKELKKQNTQKG